ncbi:hypothetical protein Leryth_011497 [Lithospermum erythrorhizon]|nr:hypothetical protein Leryth_011497 [Lithospermum erythrorhizon]
MSQVESLSLTNNRAELKKTPLRRDSTRTFQLSYQFNLIILPQFSLLIFCSFISLDPS